MVDLVEIMTETGTVTIPLESTIGAHKIPLEILIAARRRGFKASYCHDGGWWARGHVITVSGDAAKVSRFRDVVRQWVRKFEIDHG